MLFLKRLDDEGVPISVSHDTKKYLEIGDALDKAILEDILEPEDFAWVDGEKVVLSAEAKREREIKRLLLSCAKAKKIQPIGQHSE